MVAPAGSVSRVRALRQCTRSACRNPAVATLTYVYADSTAVLGPLATAAEPHAYDLCESHAQRLTVPRGWQVVRLAVDHVPAEPTEDDISALADAVREASRTSRPAPSPAQRRPVRHEGPVTHRLPSWEDSQVARRGHLRVLQGELPLEDGSR